MITDAVDQARILEKLLDQRSVGNTTALLQGAKGTEFDVLAIFSDLAEGRQHSRNSPQMQYATLQTLDRVENFKGAVVIDAYPLMNLIYGLLGRIEELEEEVIALSEDDEDS